ncbi:hypothetical protein AB0O52_18645 [Arthrobacter sp. NPDC080073]|uniref:hypothetical protein n=1 Tax=Arthrobacter sp. NPDC080073 TaxID=3155919 RepID=UPI00343769A0
MPATYAEAEESFDHYEAAHVAPSAQSQHPMDATVQVFQSPWPAPRRPLARQLTSTMLDEDRLTAALGPARRGSPGPRSKQGFSSATPCAGVGR